VRADETANQITSNSDYYVGRHVAFDCTVDAIVRADTLVGQCGKEIEPIDLYIRMTTRGRTVGDRFHVLGVMLPPASWTDAMGHTVEYPIVRAVFLDRAHGR